MKPITRRAFFASLGTAAAGAVAARALYFEPGGVVLTRHDVPVTGLPAGLAGLTIAAVSDVHLGSVPAAASAALDLLGRERPDVVVIVGDSCNREADLAEVTAFARAARGRLATFATYGNWEHWADIAPARLARAYEQAGVQLLLNEWASVTPSTPGGAPVTVVGFDDPTVSKADLHCAARAAAAEVRLWLVHSPGWVDRIAGAATDVPRPTLILAGHTHGGQVRAPFWTPHTPQGSGRFVSGWYRDTIGPLYVSRGIGTTLVRARLFCPPELPIFTLAALP